jgi:hypothetical protein
LTVELLVARDFDHKIIRQRVHDGHTDTVQTARGLVDLAVELAAGMQHGHDHFKRGLAGKLRMVLHRDAAAIVGDGQIAIGIKLDFNEIGMSGDSFVHRVVDDFGEKVVQRAFVGAADIHARTTPHRFEALEDLDGGGIIIIAAGRRSGFGGRRSCRFRRCSSSLSRLRVFRF